MGNAWKLDVSGVRETIRATSLEAAATTKAVDKGESALATIAALLSGVESAGPRIATLSSEWGGTSASVTNRVTTVIEAVEAAAVCFIRADGDMSDVWRSVDAVLPPTTGDDW